jgi:hypothetical protein
MRAHAGLTTAVVLCSILTMSGVAGAVSGSAALTGTLRLAAKGCGKQTGTLVAAMRVADDGTWTFDSAETSFRGTYAPKGRSGRTLALVLDGESAAGLVAMIAHDVGVLCEVEVTVTQSRPKLVVLKLDKRLTRATLQVRYVFKGMAAGGSGTATYRVVAKGSWVPG